MTEQSHGWRANVLDAHGRTCGGAVLVTEDLVLTCAHVVSKALGPRSPQSPAEPVTVVISAASDGGRRLARVVPDGWVEQGADYGGDLALLRLDQPVDLLPAKLAPCGPPHRRGVTAFGYRDDPATGRWADAEVAGHAGPGNSWVQLVGLNTTGYRIEPGFSGAGVVEVATQRVIGIIVGVEGASAVRVAWMISMEAVVERLPVLRPLVETDEVAPPPERRVDGAELDQLVALLATLPLDEVLQVLRATLSPLVSRPLDDPADLRSIVRHLTGHTGRSGAPPLLVFLRRLAERQNGKGSDALMAWVYRLARRWQIPVETIIAAAAEPVRPESGESYLVVEVRADLPTPGGYLLFVHLRHDDGTGRPISTPDDQPVGLQEIPGALGRPLRQALSSLSRTQRVTIEFVLPTELLGHPVDQFEVMLDNRLTRLGSAYPVVVRSGDRKRRSSRRPRWEVRSEWVRRNGHEHHEHAMKWVPLPQGITPNLELWLGLGGGYSDELPVLLVFTWHGVHLTRSIPRALDEGLKLGMPALLWCRNAKLADQFAAEMANKINGPVSQLVRRVQQLRKAADGRDDNVGSHVCLLWDLADPSTPSQGLSAPA